MSVLEEIAAERARQNAKWGEQNHPDGTGAETEPVPLWRADDFAEWAKNKTDLMARFGTVTWRDILLEEVAEALEEEDADALRAELIQVAAVATQWVEAIDRRREEVPC